MNAARAAAVALLLAAGPAFGQDNGAAPHSCGAGGLQVQVLGSGSAERGSGRAGSGYLVWIDGHPRVLIDLGAGAALRLQQSGARVADLDVVLLTRLHADHTLDFPALVAAALREGRRRPLPLYGPTGNRFAPSTVTFVRALLDGTRGAYRHLGSVLSPLSQQGFKLEPHDVRTPPARVGVRRNDPEILEVYRGERLQAAATYLLGDDALPTLAWRVLAQDRRVVFGAAASGGARLERLARDADLLVADYMRPQVDSEEHEHRVAAIARLAAAARAKHLILPRDARGRAEADAAIRAHYTGPVAVADDLDCFAVP